MSAGADNSNWEPGEEHSAAGAPARNWWWAIVLGSMVIAVIVLFVIAATDDDENIVLSRNDVVTDASGKRVWHGVMMNRTDSLYRNIAVTIRFLDDKEYPVGKTSGRAEQLEPGEELKLEAPLPEGARSIQVYSLEWETGRVSRTLGPWAPWPFGHRQYDPSG